MAAPSHGHSALPVRLTPDPAFCIKSRVLPDGPKLFLNICHDPAVPPADADVPVVLSERRDSTDKAGQPCVIVDAIFNPELCARAAKDSKLRHTLIEIALVRVEQATTLHLSRTLGTPNIKSKGLIPPFTARIPAFWATRAASVQEIDGPTTPAWSWTPSRDGCRVVIRVPDLTKSLHSSSTLDIEARRMIFTAGSQYHLDTPLLPGDTKLVGGDKFLPTTVDPDSAVAEWCAKTGEVVVEIKWASVAAREREKLVGK